MEEKAPYETGDNFNCQVLEVEASASGIIEALGIAPERAKRLSKVVSIAYHSHDNMVAAAVDYSKECRHPNELLYCCIHAQQMHEQHMMMGKLMEMLKGRHRD